MVIDPQFTSSVLFKLSLMVLFSTLRKNWLLKRNKWVDTLIEISAPIICALILLLLRTLVSPTTIGQYNFDEFAPNLRVLQHSLMSDSVLLTWACGYNGGGGGFGRQRGYQAQIGLTMRNSPNPTLCTFVFMLPLLIYLHQSICVSTWQ
jgi:hypothetical protein